MTDDRLAQIRAILRQMTSGTGFFISTEEAQRLAGPDNPTIFMDRLRAEVGGHIALDHEVFGTRGYMIFKS